MKNNKLIWISALLSVLILCLFWVDSRGFFDKGGQVIKTDTIMVSDTLYLRDTVTVDNPVPYVVEKIKTDTVFTPQGDTLHLVTETKKFQENIVQDQDTATIKAQITGINAKLDTISVIFNRRQVTNTIEITKYIEKKRKFNVGVGVGYGIGLTSRKIEPFVGISLVYNLQF